jgi:hypothetical protein
MATGVRMLDARVAHGMPDLQHSDWFTTYRTEGVSRWRQRPGPQPRPQHGRDPLYIDLLDSDVRAEVRGRGVDPQLDVDVVRGMAAAAVRDHDERSLTGAVLPVDDPDRVVDELVARVAGLGPLQPYLDDPTVEGFRSYPRPLQDGSCSGRAHSDADERV